MASKRYMLLEDLAAATSAILRCTRRRSAPRSTLVAVSGIDGSGKGYVSGRLRDALDAHQLRVAVINIDGWLNLPEKRFNATNPAEHFYLHAIRFDEMFDRLVFPLRDQRSIDRSREEVGPSRSVNPDLRRLFRARSLP